MDKLIERLRTNADTFERSEFIGDNVTGNDFREAADTLQSQALRIKKLEEALAWAAERFEHYDELHRAKGAPEGDAKAARNREYADKLRTTLSSKEE